MQTKALLTTTAAIELPTGAALLLAPSLVAELLVGEALGSGASILVGRVAGAALLAIGVSCCAERETDRTGDHAGLPLGLLIYNGMVAILLAQAAQVGRMHGPLLWPAVVAHSLLALWCAGRVLHPASALA